VTGLLSQLGRQRPSGEGRRTAKSLWPTGGEKEKGRGKRHQSDHLGQRSRLTAHRDIDGRDAVSGGGGVNERVRTPGRGWSVRIRKKYSCGVVNKQRGPP